MYGKYVECSGRKVWINCEPNTSDKELEKRAKRKIERFIMKEIDSLD